MSTDKGKGIKKDIYNDVFSPTLKTVGNTLNDLVKILLTPIRGLIWGWDKIEKCVIDGLEKRLSRKKQEKLIPPDPRIAVPIIQALQFSADEEIIREMFLNLLANDMDIDNKNLIHPSYVEIVKQMSSLDAMLLKKLAPSASYYIKVINPKISPEPDSNLIYTNVYPEWFLGYTIAQYTIFDISAALLHLQKFGLIDLMYDRTADKDGYDEIEKSDLLQPIFCQYQAKNKNAFLKSTKSIVNINDYGKSFIEICL